jgi:uncharacterized membrane protein
MNTTLLTVVKHIIAEQGEAIFIEPKRFKGWISDYAQGEPKAERLVLNRCVECGAYAELKGLSAEGRSAVKNRLARKLHNEEGLDTALCIGALDLLEAAVWGTGEGEASAADDDWVTVAEQRAAEKPAPQQASPAPTPAAQSGAAPYTPPVSAVSVAAAQGQAQTGQMRTSAMLRKAAREQLRGSWLNAAGMVFVYLLLIFCCYFVVSFVFTLINNALFSDIIRYDGMSILLSLVGTVIMSIAAYLFYGPLLLGFYGYFLAKARGVAVTTGDLFYGFRRFRQSFLLSVLMYIFVILWMLLLIVPGIVKSMSYAMAYYIALDNPGMSASDAITASRKMMYGYKGKLFHLSLSFTGWYLLCILSLGIGFFWLIPYVQLSAANFYEDLRKQRANEGIHP